MINYTFNNFLEQIKVNIYYFINCLYLHINLKEQKRARMLVKQAGQHKRDVNYHICQGNNNKVSKAKSIMYYLTTT